MGRRHGRLWRWHARAAHHIYQRLREEQAVPWLGIVVVVAGLGGGILVDVTLGALGWAPKDGTLGASVGGVVAVGWVLFAIFGGGGYGPEDRR